MRALAAWSALASSVVIALLGIFVLDLFFDLAVPQRVVVLLLAAATIGWAYCRFTRPLLGRHESEIDVALVVERQHDIDSDLVAALQFEQRQTAGWGSPQLTAAIVEYVASATREINVFAGLSTQQAVHRMAVLLAGFSVTLVVALFWPGHVRAFANRLIMGSMHYPTHTRIEQIVINHATVLVRTEESARPVDTKAAQGRPLRFVVLCAGRLPTNGSVQLTAADGTKTRTRVELRPLSLDERLARLREAVDRLNEAIQSPSSEILPPWRDEILLLIRFDVPEALQPLVAAKNPADLDPVVTAITKVTEGWPDNIRHKAILTGELRRLNDDLSYKISVGDAWTDSALVRMIPLPTVELDLTPIPPKYAAAGAPKADTSGRQLAVLEGSSVKLAVKCTNRKPLKSAWLSLQRGAVSERVDLEPIDIERTAWSPKGDKAPLAQLREELRYEVQVIDDDGLSLETPIRGAIRIRADQLPTVAAEMIHKVVLPTAAPVITYRAGDDFGISGIAVVVDVQHDSGKGAVNSEKESPLAEGVAAPPALAAQSESHRFEILRPTKAITTEGLPLAGHYALPLSPLALLKGDRLKLTLEVTDYRGENESGRASGSVQRSEPLILEISDESGVLAAISQPDQRSAEQLSEIIKRQLGIGEEP